MTGAPRVRRQLQKPIFTDSSSAFVWIVVVVVGLICSSSSSSSTSQSSTGLQAPPWIPSFSPLHLVAVSGFVVEQRQRLVDGPSTVRPSSSTTSIYFTDPTKWPTSSLRRTSFSSDRSTASLNLFRRLRRRWEERKQRKKQQQQTEDERTNDGPSTKISNDAPSNGDDSKNNNNKNDDMGRLIITNTQPFDESVIANSLDGDLFQTSNKGSSVEATELAIVGGGISGLAAAITAAENFSKGKGKAATSPRIVVVEASSKFGGRVASEKTEDGYTLDEGFAVFIEEYPDVQRLLDYDALNLKPFLPGALVKLQGRTNFGRVADPLREPADIINSLLSPVGSLIDKAKVLPLVFNVRTKSVEELFEEREVPTSDALTDRWGFSDSFISSFLQPFLEGIYLAPLSEQSSRMFSFVFKMFSEGSATLPAGGMQAVSDQLVERAKSLGIELISDCPATQISVVTDKDVNSQSYVINCGKSGRRFESSTVVVATDGAIAQKLLSNVPGFESLETLPKQPQLAVGCLYYAFKGNAPVEEPILVLNGIGPQSGTEDFPVNNICFPSVVNKGYAPDGFNLCSVTVLNKAMEIYKDRPEELDKAVRRQLGTWFPEITTTIRDEWELKKIFYVRSARSFWILFSKQRENECLNVSIESFSRYSAVLTFLVSAAFILLSSDPEGTTKSVDRTISSQPEWWPSKQFLSWKGVTERSIGMW